MSSYRLKFFTALENELSVDSFIDESRYGNTSSFSRNRFFSLRKIIVFIMVLKASYQREINSFCKKILGGDYNIREVTSGAISQARAKLNPWAFQRLNEVGVESFYSEAPYLKWHGYRLLAVDGSSLSLPNTKSIIEEFGSVCYPNRKVSQRSMARCSIIYDVLNCLTIDAQLGKCTSSEKALLEKSLDKLQEGDLLLGDRGYGYNVILHWLKERKIEFCIRLKTGHRKEVKKFALSKEVDKVVEFKYTDKLVKELGIQSGKTITVRLIKVFLENGKIEILCTSLLDKANYPRREFKELYHKRWEVEEAYKLLKVRADLESFSGRTARSIYQDFHAKILLMTICAALTFPIEEKVRQEYTAEKTGNLYNQKINKTDALAETQNNLITIFIKKIYQATIDSFDLIIEKSRSVIRPYRKEPRNDMFKKRKSYNFKRL
jgi:hypothetical protein